jgi:hypothetical protein
MSTTILAPSVFDPSNPGAQAISLADSVGNTVVDVAANLAPVAVPFVLSLVALRWALRKFALDGSAGLERGLGPMAPAPSGAYDAHVRWAEMAEVEEYDDRFDNDREFAHNMRIARKRRLEEKYNDFTDY